MESITQTEINNLSIFIPKCIIDYSKKNLNKITLQDIINSYASSYNYRLFMTNCSTIKVENPSILWYSIFYKFVKKSSYLEELNSKLNVAKLVVTSIKEYEIEFNSTDDSDVLNTLLDIKNTSTSPNSNIMSTSIINTSITNTNSMSMSINNEYNFRIETEYNQLQQNTQKINLLTKLIIDYNSLLESREEKFDINIVEIPSMLINGFPEFYSSFVKKSTVPFDKWINLFFVDPKYELINKILYKYNLQVQYNCNCISVSTINKDNLKNRSTTNRKRKNNESEESEESENNLENENEENENVSEIIKSKKRKINKCNSILISNQMNFISKVISDKFENDNINEITLKFIDILNLIKDEKYENEYKILFANYSTYSQYIYNTVYNRVMNFNKFNDKIEMIHNKSLTYGEANYTFKKINNSITYKDDTDIESDEEEYELKCTDNSECSSTEDKDKVKNITFVEDKNTDTNNIEIKSKDKIKDKNTDTNNIEIKSKDKIKNKSKDKSENKSKDKIENKDKNVDKNKDNNKDRESLRKELRYKLELLDKMDKLEENYNKNKNSIEQKYIEEQELIKQKYIKKQKQLDNSKTELDNIKRMLNL